MNRAQRKELNNISERISSVEDEINDIISDLEDIKSEEEEKVDNMPESLSFSERAEQMREVIDKLDECICDLQCICLSDVVEELRSI